MTTNVYSKIGGFYRLSMSLSGFNKALARYIGEMDFVSNSKPYILEIGAGPSPISPLFLDKFPNSRLLITDTDEKFLNIISKNFNSLINSGLAEVKKVDVNFLDEVMLPETFDIIIMGGVIGYATSPTKTIKSIHRLLKTEGVFVLIEMSPETFLGPLYSKIYGFKMIEIRSLRNFLEKNGFENIEMKDVSMKYFPLNLSRQVIVVRKK